MRGRCPVRRCKTCSSVPCTDGLSGKIWKLTATMQQGISGDDARKIAKLIRDEGPKGVRTQVQGDELRVFSKKRDDLQACQRLIQAADYDFAVQFANYR